MHVKYLENVPSACRIENGGRRQSSLTYQFKKWRLWAMEGLRPYATFFMLPTKCLVYIALTYANEDLCGLDYHVNQKHITFYNTFVTACKKEYQRGRLSKSLGMLLFRCKMEEYQITRLLAFPAHEIAYAPPQSWISQETPLPQASWNLHIIAVWNTAARLHLDNYNPTWLQNLACNIPEANWHLNNIASHPICNARHAETALGHNKLGKLYSDKM